MCWILNFWWAHLHVSDTSLESAISGRLDLARIRAAVDAGPARIRSTRIQSRSDPGPAGIQRESELDPTPTATDLDPMGIHSRLEPAVRIQGGGSRPAKIGSHAMQAALRPRVGHAVHRWCLHKRPHQPPSHPCERSSLRGSLATAAACCRAMRDSTTTPQETLVGGCGGPHPLLSWYNQPNGWTLVGGCGGVAADARETSLSHWLGGAGGAQPVLLCCNQLECATLVEG
jgi:hypothetical protein